MRSIAMLMGSHQEQGSIRHIFRKVSALSVAVSSLLLAPSALAQIHTDEIKVGTRLTAAGITMRGGAAPVLPLPTGLWEVVGRADEEVPLRNFYGRDLVPRPRVGLTLVNRNVSEPVAAMVVEYWSEVKNILWTNDPCTQGKESFVDTVGTSTGTVDYACARVWYDRTGFKRLIAAAPKSENRWRKKYIAPLEPFADSLPDSFMWMFFNTNRDLERAYGVTLFVRSTTSGKVDEAFDQNIRAWVNTTGKALIAATYGRLEAIPEFPVASEP